MCLPSYEDLVNPDDMCVVAGELAVQPPDYLVQMVRQWRLFEKFIEEQPEVADLVCAGLPIPVSML